MNSIYLISLSSYSLVIDLLKLLTERSTAQQHTYMFKGRNEVLLR